MIRVAAVEALHTVEERARNGLSIVIAPKVPRLDTTEVGSFKRRPFHRHGREDLIVLIVIRTWRSSPAQLHHDQSGHDVVAFPPIRR